MSASPGSWANSTRSFSPPPRLSWWVEAVFCWCVSSSEDAHTGVLSTHFTANFRVKLSLHTDAPLKSLWVQHIHCHSQGLDCDLLFSTAFLPKGRTMSLCFASCRLGEVGEWAGYFEHPAKRMAAGLLRLRPALSAGARHTGPLPGTALPLHHRAGPQPLHRDCGKEKRPAWCPVTTLRSLLS